MKNRILNIFLILFCVLVLNGCTQAIIGGATSGGVILVQERSAKQAGIDILIKTQIEESMFSSNYDNLFSKIRVLVYEGKVLLVGTVKEKKLITEAEDIAWQKKNVLEVANYIVVGKNDLVDYIKDTRISIELKAKLLTDSEISEVNFSNTTENRNLFIMGIARDQNELEKVLKHAAEIAGVKKVINLIVLKDDPKRVKKK